MTRMDDRPVRRIGVGRRIRQAALTAHGWIGRLAAFYLVLMFLFGTLTVFGNELEALVSPQMRGTATATPASFGALLDGAREAYPDARPLIVSRPSSPWLAASVEMRGDGGLFMVWLDPETGAVQGRTPQFGLKQVLRGIHSNLLFDHRLTIMAVSALSFAILWQIGSGLVSYRRFWRGYLRGPVSGPTARARWSGFHRWAALWSLPVLAVSALTGALYFAETLGFTPDLPPASAAAPREEALPGSVDGAVLDAAVAKARAALPGLRVAEIYLPLLRRDGIELRGDLSAWLVRPRANAVTVDMDGTTVLGVHRGEDLGLARRLTEAADPLHFGTWGGDITRVIWLVAGLLAVAVAVSGLQTGAARMAGSGTLGGVWRSVWLPFRLAMIGAVLFTLANLVRVLA